jgi:hypothetical protein
VGAVVAGRAALVSADGRAGSDGGVGEDDGEAEDVVVVEEAAGWTAGDGVDIVAGLDAVTDGRVE